MKLSKYITYEEAVKSEYGSRNGVDNTPNENQIENIKALCNNVLDKIRDYYRLPILPTSIFRSYAVNMRIGGSKTSQHLANNHSAACDFHIHSIPIKKVFDDICSGRIPIQYDQVIEEFGAWIHISYKTTGVNRMEKLIARKEHGETTYREVT